MSFLNKEEAFGLPTGTIRALLALVLVAAFIGTVFIEVVNPESQIALAAMASSAVTFYFTKRGDESVGGSGGQ